MTERDDGVQIEPALTADPELYEALGRLVPQLSSSAGIPTAYDLETIIENPATTLFVAREAEGEIVGLLTLAVFRTPTGARAWIEDVVVDEGARGRQIAPSMIEAAVEAARRAEARTVDLTSRPGRESANRMYQRLGFELRETNVYRLTLTR